MGTIAEIRMLRDAGLSKTAVAKRLKLHRRAAKPRMTKVEPYREYITSRLEQYPELHGEVQTLET